MGTSSSDKLDTILTKNRVASESLPHAPPSHTAQNHLIPISGDIGTFLMGKRVIMRCLEKWRILPLNFGSMTAGWEDGGMWIPCSRNTKACMHALRGTQCGSQMTKETLYASRPKMAHFYFL